MLPSTVETVGFRTTICMIVNINYSIETYYDWNIYVDYIGECKEKKELLRELFNVIQSVYPDDVILESRLTIKETGAFLRLGVKESDSIRLSDVTNFVYSFLDIVGDTTNEKNTNKHD